MITKPKTNLITKATIFVGAGDSNPTRVCMDTSSSFESKRCPEVERIETNNNIIKI